MLREVDFKTPYSLGYLKNNIDKGQIQIIQQIGSQYQKGIERVSEISQRHQLYQTSLQNGQFIKRDSYLPNFLLNRYVANVDRSYESILNRKNIELFKRNVIEPKLEKSIDQKMYYERLHQPLLFNEVGALKKVKAENGIPPTGRILSYQLPKDLVNLQLNKNDFSNMFQQMLFSRGSDLTTEKNTSDIQRAYTNQKQPSQQVLEVGGPPITYQQMQDNYQDEIQQQEEQQEQEEQKQIQPYVPKRRKIGQFTSSTVQQEKADEIEQQPSSAVQAIKQPSRKRINKKLQSLRQTVQNTTQVQQQESYEDTVERDKENFYQSLKSEVRQIVEGSQIENLQAAINKKYKQYENKLDQFNIEQFKMDQKDRVGQAYYTQFMSLFEKRLDKAKDVISEKDVVEFLERSQQEIEGEIQNDIVPKLINNQFTELETYYNEQMQQQQELYKASRMAGQNEEEKKQQEQIQNQNPVQSIQGNAPSSNQERIDQKLRKAMSNAVYNGINSIKNRLRSASNEKVTQIQGAIQQQEEKRKQTSQVEVPLQQDEQQIDQKTSPIDPLGQEIQPINQENGQVQKDPIQQQQEREVQQQEEAKEMINAEQQNQQKQNVIQINVTKPSQKGPYSQLLDENLSFGDMNNQSKLYKFDGLSKYFDSVIYQLNQIKKNDPDHLSVEALTQKTFQIDDEKQPDKYFYEKLNSLSEEQFQQMTDKIKQFQQNNQNSYQDINSKISTFFARINNLVKDTYPEGLMSQDYQQLLRIQLLADHIDERTQARNEQKKMSSDKNPETKITSNAKYQTKQLFQMSKDEMDQKSYGEDTKEFEIAMKQKLTAKYLQVFKDTYKKQNGIDFDIQKQEHFLQLSNQKLFTKENSLKYFQLIGQSSTLDEAIDKIVGEKKSNTKAAGINYLLNVFGQDLTTNQKQKLYDEQNVKEKKDKKDKRGQSSFR